MFKGIIILSLIVLAIASLDSPKPEPTEYTSYSKASGMPTDSYGNAVVDTLPNGRVNRFDPYFDNNYDAILGHHNYSSEH